MYTKPTKSSHLCKAKRRAKGIILYRFNIFIITTTIKHVVTVIQIYLFSADKVVVALNLNLILSSPVTVYRCQFKWISFDKQFNLEINKIFTTCYVGYMKRTLLHNMFWSAHNNKCTITTILFVKMKLTKISICIQTMVSNFQKAITHDEFLNIFLLKTIIQKDNETAPKLKIIH